jgi:hypothetical protein
MKVRQTEIQITLSEKEGAELKNQIVKLLGGTDMSLYVHPLKGTPLSQFYELLARGFNTHQPNQYTQND